MESGLRTSLVVSVAAIFVALAVRLPGVGSSEVWIDEAFTQFAVSRDWLDLIENRVQNGHSPFYFLLLKASGIDPLNLGGLRSISVVFDALACGVLAYGAARLIGPKAGVFTALFYALSPHFVIWSQNARPYSLLMLALAVGLLGAVEMIRRSGPGTPRGFFWPGAAMSGGLTVASATLTGGVIATAIIALSPLLARNLCRSPGFAGAWLVALIPPAIACAAMAWFVTAPDVARNYGDYWAEKVVPFSIGSLARMISHLFLGELLGTTEPVLTAFSPRAQLIAGIILALPMGVFLLAGAAVTPAVPWRRPLLLLAFGYPLVLLAISTQTSLLVARYFSPSLVAGAILVGAGLAWGWDRRWLRPLVLGVLAASGIAALSRGYSDGYPRDAEAARVAAFVTGSGGPDLNILVASEHAFPHDLRLETVLAGITRPGTPVFIKASPERMLEVIGTSARPSVVIERVEFWESVLSTRLPAPDCFVVIGTRFVASYGAIPAEACP